MAPLLTEIKIKALKPQDKIYRVFDDRGLYLEVSPAGGGFRGDNKNNKGNKNNWHGCKMMGNYNP